ncbi:MAG: hypothetical protein ACHQJ6_09150 [Candidatus Berkiellales bacterium]
MEILNPQHFKFIGSANILPNHVFHALEMGVRIYRGPWSSIDEASQNYAAFGRFLSEKLFNALHPNPLGKMVYTQSTLLVDEAPSLPPS